MTAKKTCSSCGIPHGVRKLPEGYGSPFLFYTPVKEVVTFSPLTAKAYNRDLHYLSQPAKAQTMFAYIVGQLRNHAPFTIFGAITGIVIMIVSYNMPFRVSYQIFYVLHPIHVVLSALVTSSMYELHASGKCRLWVVIPIGYVGSIGIATLSDSIIPYLAEALLNLRNRAVHLGFIEKYWLVNPLAFLGIAVACFRPRTKFPHAGHVLLSTWASLFHIIMAMGGRMNSILITSMFLFLFLAVWLPCCLSDIVFPLLFVKEKA